MKLRLHPSNHATYLQTYSKGEHRCGSLHSLLHRRSGTARSHHLAALRVAHTYSPVGPAQGRYRELLKEATPPANHGTHISLERDNMIKNHKSEELKPVQLISLSRK
jgi:hypothetical protein